MNLQHSDYQDVNATTPTPNNGGNTQKDGGWRKDLRRLPVLYQASPADIDAIEVFIATHEAQVRDEIRKMVKGMRNSGPNYGEEGYSASYNAALDDILTKLQAKNQEV